MPGTLYSQDGVEHSRAIEKGLEYDALPLHGPKVGVLGLREALLRCDQYAVEPAEHRAGDTDDEDDTRLPVGV